MKYLATALQPPQRPLALLQRLGKETLRGRNINSSNYKIQTNLFAKGIYVLNITSSSNKIENIKLVLE